MIHLTCCAIVLGYRVLPYTNSGDSNNRSTSNLKADKIKNNRFIACQILIEKTLRAEDG